MRKLGGKPPEQHQPSVEIDMDRIKRIGEALDGEFRQAVQKHTSAANFVAKATAKSVQKVRTTSAAIDELAKRLEGRMHDEGS
jgi:ethanolamine ammonia-lyase large subunit